MVWAPTLASRCIPKSSFLLLMIGGVVGACHEEEAQKVFAAAGKLFLRETVVDSDSPFDELLSVPLPFQLPDAAAASPCTAAASPRTTVSYTRRAHAPTTLGCTASRRGRAPPKPPLPSMNSPPRVTAEQTPQPRVSKKSIDFCLGFKN